uniref:Uncharacterized protein n=1 Tax=Brassica oleracea TaxID=3712 RepID=A0A3P6BCQ8_BRAOL|nr:unnamed protein product [Brassica oleracea]
MGPLRHSSSRATHHALQEDSQLPAAAGEPCSKRAR